MEILTYKKAIHYRLSRHPDDLRQVLALQAKNLDTHLSPEVIRTQGFVTVKHSMDSLQLICGKYGHMLAFDKDQLVAYALVMLNTYADKIPVLIPMFEQINLLKYQNQLLCEQAYLVMGQVCVDEPYRGTGVFLELYQHMASALSPHFKYIITEVASRNPRSIRAHKKVGFQCIHRFTDATDVWQIILWDWQK